jgi:hypothetical protein
MVNILKCYYSSAISGAVREGPGPRPSMASALPATLSWSMKSEQQKYIYLLGSVVRAALFTRTALSSRFQRLRTMSKTFRIHGCGERNHEGHAEALV